MTLLLLLIPAWILIVSLVLGLCLAARRGEEQVEAIEAVPAWEQAADPAFHQMFTSQAGPASTMVGSASGVH